MSAPPAYLPPDVARARVRAELDAIDAALERLRECSTDEVGNAFVARRAVHELRRALL